MKKLLPFCFLLIAYSLPAQEWSVGTSWHYYQYGFISQFPPTIKTIKIVGDSIIDGYPVFKIQGDCQCSPIEAKYLRKDGDKVYWYEAGSFHLLYDFSLSPGDSLHVDYFLNNNEYALFRIDSIDFYDLPNGDSLKVQYISMYDTLTYQHQAGWGLRIIENIGNDGCMFPAIGVCDPPTWPLVCFETQAGTFYPIGATASCAEIVDAVGTADQPLVILLRPNIVTNIAQVRSSHEIANYIIFDAAGRRVGDDSPKAAEFEMQVESMKSGIYFVVFKLKDGRQAVRKFVRN